MRGPAPGFAGLCERLGRDAFGFADRAAHRRRRVGVEVELLPRHADTGRIARVSGAEGEPGTLDLLRAYARARGWAEEASAKGAPRFRLPGGGRLTFEPGGQLEYSGPPLPSVTAVLDHAHAVILPLRAYAADHGIQLEGLGIDPCGTAADAPFQVVTERYRRMADYFARIGPAGAAMMRQTAAVQVNLDFEDRALDRWRLLNAAVPYLIAIFANSPVYGGAPTGQRSTRAHVWLQVDPLRTGIFRCDVDPVTEYAAFALSAPALHRAWPGPPGAGRGEPTHGGDAGPYRPMREWIEAGLAAPADWAEHLSTLFPEVRPRGYLEVRSPDAIEPEWYAAPVVLLAGITYHEPTRLAAAELLGAPDRGLLRRAAGAGLRDAGIHDVACELFRIGLEGAAGLGPEFVAPRHIEAARAFFEQYTRLGRAPADDRADAADTGRVRPAVNGTGGATNGTGTAEAELAFGTA